MNPAPAPSSDRSHHGLILLPAGDAYAFDGRLPPAARLQAFAHARIESRRRAFNRAQRSPGRWFARRGVELMRVAGLA